MWDPNEDRKELLGVLEKLEDIEFTLSEESRQYLDKRLGSVESYFGYDLADGYIWVYRKGEQHLLRFQLIDPYGNHMFGMFSQIISLAAKKKDFIHKCMSMASTDGFDLTEMFNTSRVQHLSYAMYLPNGDIVLAKDGKYFGQIRGLRYPEMEDE